MTEQQWIDALNLQPHPEGGWYREVYRATESIPQQALPARFSSDRSFSTAIYYLLGPGDFSALHRIHQDELWHFYDGSKLLIDVIHPDGQREQLQLGRNAAAGEQPLAMVPAGSWFGARVAEPDRYCLAGCTVAPGFDFADFDMPGREQLVEMFPEHAELIEQLTR